MREGERGGSWRGSTGWCRGMGVIVRGIRRGVETGLAWGCCGWHGRSLRCLQMELLGVGDARGRGHERKI